MLDPGDLITAVELGAPAPRSTYRKVRDRATFAFAVFSVAAAVELEDGAVKEARIALGGVAHVPWRAERAEAVLRGREASAEASRRRPTRSWLPREPLRDNAFKVPLARNVLIRTLSELTA